MKLQQSCWREIKAELKKLNIRVLEIDDISRSHKNWLEQYFKDKVFPVLTPMAVGVRVNNALHERFGRRVGYAVICSINALGCLVKAFTAFSRKK